MSDSLVANETTVSIVRITFGNSLIDGAQVQVDSIVQVERQSPIDGAQVQVDSIVQVKRY